ncbi:MAG: phosphoesterase [Caldisphaera sp.]|jgi:single-stranded DNA-specific DHH superfamily exonuclease
MSENIAIIADWDADGVIAAAAIVYSQEKLGVFPLKGRHKIELIPSGPREMEQTIKGHCWDVLIILDIPFSQEVGKALDELSSNNCRPRIYYFDHHPVTLENMSVIESKYNALAILGKSPTAVLVKRFLDGLNVKLTPRLLNLIDAIGTLEGGGWLRSKQQISEGIIKLAASISKALNQSKDKNIWIKYVEWASNPLPFEQSLLKQGGDEEFKNVIDLGIEVSKESDKEIKEIAMELAISAKNLGYLKFVDARNKWNKSGASALASAIYKTLKMTTALLVEKEDNVRLLIIRSGRGEALKIMKNLYNMGVTEDVGGHGNIAVAKLKQEITIKILEDSLRKASISSLSDS